MKKIFFSVLIFVATIFAASCKNNQAETTKETNIVNDTLTTETLTEVNPLDILKRKKIEIDSFVSQNPKNLTILVKRIDRSDLFQIANEIFPEDVETTFNIVKDKTGHIIYACEIPNSESGDWFVALNHYFDKNGKTFAFEKQTNEFNSGCEEITYETKTEYYNNDFKSIGSEYKLVDKKKKELRKKDCDLMEYKYKVVSNNDNYLKTKSIKKAHTIYRESSSDFIENKTETDSKPNTNPKDVNLNVKNYISACIEIVDDFSPYSKLGYVNIFNTIFDNNPNIVNKNLLKQQLSAVLTNKEQRDLFFKGHLKFFGRNESSLFMNIDSMNDYTNTQFNGDKLVRYILENY